MGRPGEALLKSQETKIFKSFIRVFARTKLYVLIRQLKGRDQNQLVLFTNQLNGVKILTFKKSQNSHPRLQIEFRVYYLTPPHYFYNLMDVSSFLLCKKVCLRTF